MKHTKRMLAILLSLAMVLTMTIAMGATAFAEDDPPAFDTPLKVTGLADEDTVHFYQVIEWVGNETGNVAGWKAVAPFDTVLDKDTLTAVLVGKKAVPDDPETDEDESEEAVPPSGITTEIAGKLAAAATGSGVSPSIVDGTATLENEEAGMWMALVTPADANTIYNPVFVSSDFNKEDGGTIGMGDTYAAPESVAKSSTLTLTKSATTSEDSWDDNKPNTTAVGDTVNFTVNTTIPGYGSVYEHPHFVLTDTLTDLKLKKDDSDKYIISLTAPAGLNNKADVEEGEDYDYEIVPNANEQGYTITFTENYLKTVKSATVVTVTYSAVVTSSAGYAISEEDNDVYIEYSHNPNQQTDYDVKKDTTQHYTFSIDASGIAAGESETIHGKKTSEVVKVGVDAKGDPITQVTEHSDIGDPEVDKWTGPLEGAVFGLFVAEDEREPLFDKDGNKVTAETGADGRMNFKGLDAGTYYIKEISAPAGYVTDPDFYEVVIAAEVETVTVTEWWNGNAFVDTKPATGTAKEVTYETEILKSYTVTINGSTVAEYTFENKTEVNSTEIQWDEAKLIEHPFAFQNIQGTELPSTGGIGTIIFYVVGTILVLGCGIVLISRRRLNNR